MLFYTIFYNGDGRFDRTIESGRIVGIGIHSSLGSIIMSTGIILLILLRKIGIINIILFLSLIILFFAASVFIGRTGVLVEILTLLIGSFWIGKIKGLIFSVLLPSFFSFFMISSVLNYMDPAVSDKLQTWILAATDDSRRSDIMESAVDTGIPQLDYNMIFGFGVVSGKDANGGYHHTDSGYIRTIIALGIVGFLCYYLSMLFLLLSSNIKLWYDKRPFWILLITIAFLIEIKEPYFLRYVYAWFIMTLMLFCSFANSKLSKYEKNKNSICIGISGS